MFFNTNRPWRRWLTTSSTATSFTAPAPTLTKPSGDNTVETGHKNQCIPRYCQVMGCGTDAANETFDCRIWGWARCPDLNSPPGDLWVPAPLVFATFTLGAMTGVAGSNVMAATDFVCDTIVITGEYVSTADTTNDGHSQVFSPAADLAAVLCFGVKGYELLQADFDSTGSASSNLLYALED